MKKTLHTRQQINAAMMQAKVDAEKQFTFAYVQSIRPKQNVTDPCQAESFEIERYDDMEIDTMIAKLLEAKEKGAHKVSFSTYSDGETIEIDFEGTRLETDSEWETRITRTREDFLRDAMNRVKNEMEAHNSKVQQYLDLKKELES